MSDTTYPNEINSQSQEDELVPLVRHNKEGFQYYYPSRFASSYSTISTKNVKSAIRRGDFFGDNTSFINPEVNQYDNPSSPPEFSACHGQVFRLGFMTVFLVLCFLWLASAVEPTVISNINNLEGNTHFAQHRLWAQYSPFFPVRKYQPPPSVCEITQVNLLQRHGARFPTSGASSDIQATIQKLQSVKVFTDPKLNFLKTFTYDLGANDLIEFGAEQSFASGEDFFDRYPGLVTSTKLPFVRSSSGERVVLSATNWTAGFSTASHHVYNPVLSVILDESRNDTLDDNMCPSAGSSSPQTNQWLATYAPPIAKRLNGQAPGANLTNSDIFNLLSTCPFETVFHETRSPFCNLFTSQEFADFEYSGDLDKYYGTGYGQPLGRIQGVGYVNELLARLTHTPVNDSTQTNTTLDSSPLTFPLDRGMYADFSHDNQMIAIYAAMGLFKQPKPLDPTKPDKSRTWKVSEMVPFSAQMVTEKMSCTVRGPPGRRASSPATTTTTKEFVRVLVSDVVQPLEFCGGASGEHGGFGMCELDAFVTSQAYSRNGGEGDFEKCFA